jgi:hypothetical protein
LIAWGVSVPKSAPPSGWTFNSVHCSPSANIGTESASRLEQVSGLGRSSTALTYGARATLGEGIAPEALMQLNDRAGIAS